MRWLRFTIILLLASLLQASTLSDAVAVTTLRIKPDFLLILLVFFAINCDTYDAVIASFAIGLAADITGSAMGPFFLTFGILGAALAHIRQIIQLKQTIYQAIMIFIIGLLAAIISHLLTMFKIPSALSYNFRYLVGAAIYSALLWFIVKWLVYGLGSWAGAGKKLSHRR